MAQLIAQGWPLPLHHQLSTSQHRKHTGNYPRLLLPQSPSFQTRESASSVPTQLFQGCFVLHGGQRPLSAAPHPSISSSLLAGAGLVCLQQRSPLQRTCLSTSHLSRVSQSREHPALAALLICSRFKSPLREEPIPAGNINDIVLE